MVSPYQANDAKPLGECNRFPSCLGIRGIGDAPQDACLEIVPHHDVHKGQQSVDYAALRLHLLRAFGTSANPLRTAYHYWGLPQRMILHDHQHRPGSAMLTNTSMSRDEFSYANLRLPHFMELASNAGPDEMNICHQESRMSPRSSSCSQLPVLVPPYPFWGFATRPGYDGTTPSTTVLTLRDARVSDKTTKLAPMLGVPTKAVDKTQTEHANTREGTIGGEGPPPGSRLEENHYKKWDRWIARTQMMKVHDDGGTIILPSPKHVIVPPKDETVHHACVLEQLLDGGKETKRICQVVPGVTTMMERSFSPPNGESKEGHTVVPSHMDQKINAAPPLNGLGIMKKKTKKEKTRSGMPPVIDPSDSSPPPRPEDCPSNVFTSTALYQGAVDEEYLTEYQCELRKHLEVFEAGPNDVRASASPGRTGLVKLGQVGIRCRYCAATSRPHLATRTGGAAYYSKTIAGIYQLAQNMTKGHLSERCYYIPPDIKSRLTVLRKNNRRAERGKDYWTKSIQAAGVYESPSEGILRVRNSPTGGAVIDLPLHQHTPPRRA
jgi:hypothetical protein